MKVLQIFWNLSLFAPLLMVEDFLRVAVIDGPSISEIGLASREMHCQIPRGVNLMARPTKSSREAMNRQSRFSFHERGNDFTTLPPTSTMAI